MSLSLPLSSLLQEVDNILGRAAEEVKTLPPSSLRLSVPPSTLALSLQPVVRKYFRFTLGFTRIYPPSYPKQIHTRLHARREAAGGACGGGSVGVRGGAGPHSLRLGPRDPGLCHDVLQADFTLTSRLTSRLYPYKHATYKQALNSGSGFTRHGRHSKHAGAKRENG